MAQKATKAVPEGMYTITPQLWFNGNCREAIDFYKKALNASLTGEISETPDGKGVWHAMLKIGNSNIMLSDAMPDRWEAGPKNNTTMGLWLYVEDCDTLFKNVIKYGGKEVMPVTDAFWGDRMGEVKDPFGHCWFIATRKWNYTPEEMKQKEEEAIAQMKQN